ncbi:hypothetical protein K1719_028540 [Acacia pycnantha]|nr:hypothetical protein K1719_028540 [Acacia pycnantha]
MDCFMYWNTRGAYRKGILRNLRMLCKGPKPSLLVLAETKTEDLSRFQSLLLLGFDSVRAIPSFGRSGGLTIAWKSNVISISVVEESCQFFHLHCQSLVSPSFFVTAVYVIPHSNLRSELWNDLLRISQSMSDPWSIIGDFNDILTADERIGGRGGNPQRMKWFQDRVNDCGLVNMGLVGPKMT